MAAEQRIKALDGLRGVAILEIVCYHLGVSGFTGMLTRQVITFFFIISGYMMALRYGNTSGRGCPGVKEILTRRLAHFLPLYWLTLVPIVLFSDFGFRWDLPFHILLLQSWIPDSYYGFSYNGVAWFMSTLLVCYACFPMLDKLLCTGSVRQGVLRLVTVAAVMFAVIYVVQPSGDYVYYIFPPVRMIDFAAGMLLCKAAVSRRSGAVTQVPAWRATLVEVGILAVAVACYVMAIHTPAMPKTIQYTLLWYVPAMLIIVHFTDARMCTGALVRMLSARVVVHVGELSMEIFIIHYLTLILTRKVIAATHIGLPQMVRWLAALIVTVVVAEAAHRFITVKLRRSINAARTQSTPPRA